MSESAHYSRTAPIRPKQYLPSMAPCGAGLPNEEEKRMHERDCEKCAVNEQHNAQPSFHYAQVAPVSTTPNGPAWYTSSSTTDSTAGSTSSDLSSILDSRRSSINTDGFLTDPAYPRDIAQLSSDGTGLDGDSASKEHRPKRTRSKMSDYKKKKAHGKNVNEQAKRLDLAVYMRNLQDRIYAYCGISEGTIQATPNGKSSGLWNCKEDIMANTDAVLIHLLDKAMKKAIEENCVDSFIEEMNKVPKDYRVKQKNNIPVTQGTLLDDGGADECESRTNERDIRCTTHNHHDVRECRKERAKQAVARNSALYKDQVRNRRTK